MITGEYLVLHGASALAVPVKYGQSLHVENTGQNGILTWETHVRGHVWFTGTFKSHDVEIVETSHKKTATFLQGILKAAGQLNPLLFNKDKGIRITSHINFDIKWGLGSSSSLIANIAQWAGVDAFDLFFRTSNGSGYDIACAQNNKPIQYKIENKKPVWSSVDFWPPFSDKVFFVYLGKKKNSEQAIRQFSNNGNVVHSDLEATSSITHQLVQTKELGSFEELITKHEHIIGSIINETPVKKTLFPELNGAVKSLGAWGGDFAMLTWPGNQDELQEYLKGKGLKTFFRFDELVKYQR
ncbi:MAG: hypothetical protein K9I94_09935 [Bacteroidales bacterium]|nr:hypothetical protein [Bacteroidales bacterium]